MEDEAPHQWLNLALISLSLLFLLYRFVLHKNTTRNHHLPPSPPALPVIGHLHLVKEPLHRTLHDLSLEHGQVFFLRLGSRKTVVVSSLPAVEECFTDKDVAFANRPRLLSGKLLNYDYSTMGLCPYGDYWRNLRRFTAVEMFSAKPLADYSTVRHEEVLSLAKQLFRDHSCLGDKSKYCLDTIYSAAPHEASPADLRKASVIFQFSLYNWYCPPYNSQKEVIYILLFSQKIGNG